MSSGSPEPDSIALGGLHLQWPEPFTFDSIDASLVVELGEAGRLADLIESVQSAMPTSSIGLIERGGIG